MTKKGFSDYGDRSPVDRLDKLQEPARTPKKASTKKSSPNQKGCSGNDGKEHVYAHILSIYNYATKPEPVEYHRWGPCMGCGHVHRNRKRSDKPTGVPDVVNNYVMKSPTIWHGFNF